MTPVAINVAIAKAIGWKFEQIEGRYIGGTIWEITDPDGHWSRDQWHEEYRTNDSRTGVDTKVHLFLDLDETTLKKAGVPNFYGDLNAMAEAEKWLKEQPKNEYSKNCFWAYCSLLRERHGPCATAPKRAETFLRIIERWVE